MREVVDDPFSAEAATVSPKLSVALSSERLGIFTKLERGRGRP